MNRILIVKVTSLGDIVHGQPVVSDLHRAFPGIKVDWAADSAFADILRWNPGIDRVLCAPLRGFKKRRGLDDLKAIAASIGELRREKYDAVLDLHGVYKSAIIAFLARSRRRYGYRAEDLGESGAAFAYTERYAPRGNLNALDGLRNTVSQVFGYSLEGAPRFGLRIPAPAMALEAAKHAPFALFFHATSSDEKKWPVGHWHSIGRSLVDQGITPLLPWGSEAEHKDAVAIAEGIPGAIVLPRLSVEAVAQHIEMAALIVGTDTGFVHLASALQKPTVMIFTATSRGHFGINVPGLSTSVGDEGRPASVDEVREAIGAVLDRPEDFTQSGAVKPYDRPAK
ncbi:ADP-heptose--LPS heptosyltransferase [Paraburkholderia phytofirmans OLGA172]|uniref:Lipopolysaccharide heptosyltransferase 1 n=1 Tax=Paraburkholderia phytofirmans OLGA172 TaxID=1417228 RepID=A0A161I1S3_9BURK|nr:lipopolysaccharide heptosyltransferase I [Paraburkholderia phytofirmans]ANB71733.1 ADP-heptose--LPS heptosyltransferase [Paraburkholderia phytofirmans OLGA172]